MLAGLALAGLCLVCSAPSASAATGPSVARTATQARTTPDPAIAVAALRRRATRLRTPARLRRDLRHKARTPVALNRDTLAANRTALAGRPGEALVAGLLRLDGAVARLDTRAARLARRLRVPHRRAVSARVLALRAKVAACARRLRALPGPSPPSGPSIDLFERTGDGCVHVFSDQLPLGDMSDPLVRFAATHYVGSQKQTGAEIARLRAYDPGFVLLHYRLATASGSAAYIRPDGTWGSDWQEVSAQESWFEHRLADGSRLHHEQWGWDLHDITRPAFRDYWVDSTVATMRAMGAQGVFADSFTAGIGGLLGQPAGDPRFDGTGALTGPWDGSSWIDRLETFSDAVETSLRATPEEFLYLPNLGQLTTSWSTLDLSGLDGGMLEGFAMDAPGYGADAAEYAAAMDRALALTRSGKVIIVQPDLIGGTTGEHRGFLTGTYFLLAGDHTYLNITNGDAGGMYWFPEYGLDLGAPLTPPATGMSEYDLADGVRDQVYRRDFSAGRIIVNGADVYRTVDLGDSVFTRVRGTGGGAVTEAQITAGGAYTGGALVATTVTGGIALAPGEALILTGAVPTAPDEAPPVVAFPTEALPGTQVGSLAAGYETSGIAWHEGLRRVLVVSDGGIYSSMNADGSGIVDRVIPGDLEAVCVADPLSDLVYVGVEHPDGVLEVDAATGVVTRRFDLTPWMTGAANQGLEALAFVPSSGSPEGGLFYAGLQADGRIYVFELPIVTSGAGTSVRFERTITLDAGLTDLAGLSYDRDAGVLLAVFDGPDRLVAATTAGQVLRRWDLPGTEQEAVCFHDGDLFIGEDHGGVSTGKIICYSPFRLP